MSSSLKVAGIVCLSLISDSNAFTLSSAPAARLAAVPRSALSPATRPPRVASLRMQQQTDAAKDTEAAAKLSAIADTDAPKKESIDLSEVAAEVPLVAAVEEEAVKEIERSSAEVREAVVAKRSKMSGASSPKKQEDNAFAATALKFGALKPNSPLLTSNLVGNKGFDPLNIAQDAGLLRQYREAEIKHGRLAMLASVGWVASELLHPSLASLLSKPSLLASTAAGIQEKAPSVLNGGLDKVPTWLWVVAVVGAAVVDVSRMVAISEQPLNFTPGALGFDPLKFLAASDEEEKRALELKELNNGRLAMLAIAAFAAKEYAFDAAIVKQSPQLFTAGPLSYALSIPSLLLQYTGLFSCQTGLVYCSQGDSDVVNAILKTTDAGVAEQAEYINSIMSTSLLL